MLTSAQAVAQPTDLPPVGRSQFDYLVGANPVPFPYSKLVAHIEKQLAPIEGLSPVKITLIPLGRSLQRAASAPDFFRFPRVVLAVDGAAKAGSMPLKDRLFIGYNEKAAVLEVISYNEQAGRFEFQVVRDYRQGAEPKVSYARREICLACHQNHAPIFARPLWDETPANPAIAERLKAEGRDFYGVKLSGSDVAYFIDIAAARANLFPVWQDIWRNGCGSGVEGDACRRELFIAALRYGLSGVLPDEAELRSLAHMLDTRWNQAWPKGLAIPNSNIPNRDPLAFVADDSEAPKSTGLAPQLAALARVPARFEPLSARPPLEVWQQPDKARLIVGIAGLIESADLKALDQGLHVEQAAAQQIKFDCDFTRKEAARRVVFACAGKGAKLAGAWQLNGGKVSGRVDEIALPNSVLPAAIEMADGIAGKGTARFTLRREGLHARLADGRSLAQLDFALSASGKGTALLTLRDDFAPVGAQVNQLPVAAGAFHARNSMLPLLSALHIRYPVTPAVKLPPPQVQPQAPAASRPGIQASFERFCGQCHDTGERFPPNFMHGESTDVAKRLDHCAERIFYRLSMWQLDESKRGKTPMPPELELQQHGFNVASWTRAPELAALRRHAEQRVAARQNPQRVLSQTFESLPACLPAQ